MAKVKKAKKNPTTPGTKFTKNITRGANKGDNVTFKVAPGGKPYPIRVNKDVGTRSTLRDNPGVKFPGDKPTKKKSRKTPKS